MACSELVLVFAALIALSSARAVNISNTWMLPEEGFPVFYRYFRDRISWYEADAVCQFHHANLVTADSTSQYDAIRAYLKELDITNKVWIGLSKTSERPNFSWTDFRPLTGDGHWQEAIPKANDPICVAVDPAADFLWTPLSCGGPEVASFICELPIPSWALGPRGCLLTELPSLTVLYIPEQSAIELTSDCGLDGTKRIACKGSADREEILKQLTCAISHEDFDEKSTRLPLISSTIYETSSDENSLKTTKTWIWTSNTVDIDYGMPTRHRRETEDTLSPISTKSTTGLSTPNRIYRKKITSRDSFTTPSTIYVNEVTTSNLENDSTLDSTVTGDTDKSTSIINKTPENLTGQDLNTPSEKPTETISATDTSTAESKYTENAVNDTSGEYPSAINQGQLFGVNGSFDIIELKDIFTDVEAKTSQDRPSTNEADAQTHEAKSSQAPTSTVALAKDFKLQKPTKKEIYKLSTSRKMYKMDVTSSPKPSLEKLTKEVELYPIVKDPSLKLNRTFRKELPPISEDYSETGGKSKLEISKLINLSINNDLSNPITEHVEIKLEGENDNITETLFIRTSSNHIEKPKQQTSVPITETTEIENKEAPTTVLTEIDPKIDVLNSNLTRDNDSETIDNNVQDVVKETSQTTAIITKEEFLPKSLLGEAGTASNVTKSEAKNVSEDPLENEPEEQPRPNRQRQLTRPQRRSFYPYFFSRVLG